MCMHLWKAHLMETWSKVDEREVTRLLEAREKNRLLDEREATRL